MTQPVQPAFPYVREPSADAGDGTSADTNIYVTTHDPVTPPTTLPPVESAPVIAPPPSIITQTTNITTPEPQPLPQPQPVAIADIPRNYATTTETTTTSTAPAPVEYATHIDTKTHTSINWRKVVKGAAIVVGVVAVAVVGFYALSAATTWALGTETGAAIYTAMEPAITTVANGASWLGGFLGHVPAAIGGFFTHALGFTAAASTTAATAATAATVAPATVAAASTAAGYVGAGIAGAAGIVMAGPALEGTHVVDQATTQIAHTVPVDPGTMDTHQHSMGQDQFVPNPNLLANKQALIGAHDLHSMEHANHAAAELGHHSLHATSHHNAGHHIIGHDTHQREHNDHDQSSAGDDSMPDTPDDEPHSPARRRSWRDKIFGANSSNSYQQAYQASGSHAAAVQASAPTRSTNSIPQPSASYAQDLNQQRAQLEAALSEPTR